MGFALWFYNYSTFRGRAGIYLEDLFVRPEARGVGAGKALLARLAQRCVDAELGRLEWGGAQLEPALDRILRQPGRFGEDRVDGPPAGRRGAGAPGGVAGLNLRQSLPGQEAPVGKPGPRRKCR